jgi:hypothetical protein
MHCIDKPCSGFVRKRSVAKAPSAVSGLRAWRTIRDQGDTPVDADPIFAGLNPQRKTP